MDALHQLEIDLIIFLQGLGSWLAEPMRLVSMLGSEEFFMLVMPSLYWSFNAALGFRIAVILLLSNGLNGTLKLAFHSPRPYWLDSRVTGYVSEHSFGIPSAHAQTAAGIWGMLAASRRRTWERAALVSIIILIGFSRIYLGVHFISDVIAGWLAGGLLLYGFLKLERPVADWLKLRSLNQMLVLSLVTAAIIALMVILPAVTLGSWQVPAAWMQNALSSQPNDPINPLNLDSAFTFSGTWFGLMAGVAWLYHRQGGFDASGTPRQRILRYLIGVAGVFLLWFGLGQVLPRNADILSYSLRFIRYTVIGLWIAALAPLVFERTGLARAGEKKFPSFSSRENPL